MTLSLKKDYDIRGKLFNVWGDTEDKSVFPTIQNGVLYEPHIIPFYNKILPKGYVCFDVGANIGVLAMYMTTYTDEKIYCFEPNPSVFKTLSMNIEENKLNIIPINKAVSNSSDPLSFVVYNHLNGNSAIDNGVNIDYSICDKIDVPSTTLDDFVEENKIDKLDFIKFDVEGFEQLIFEKADRTIKTLDPEMTTEFCPTLVRQRGLDPEKYFDILKSYYRNVYFMDRYTRNVDLVPLSNFNFIDRLLIDKYDNIGDLFCTNRRDLF